MYEVILENLDAVPGESALYYGVHSLTETLKYLEQWPNRSLRHEEPGVQLVYSVGIGHKHLTVTKICGE